MPGPRADVTNRCPSRVVLVGGGHAHLEVLRRQVLEAHRGIALTLVSAAAKQHYSGMVPGFLAGTYREEEIAFDLAALSERAGARFVEGTVVAIDPERRLLRLADADTIEYDLVSFAVGSGARGSALPGVREHAWTVKPIHRAVSLRQALERVARGGGTVRAVVVGAGAGGVEVACAAASVFDRAGCARQMTILESGDEILGGYSARFRRVAQRALDGKRIAVRLRASVSEVRSGSLLLADGQEMASSLTVWLTGPSPPELFGGSGLSLDARGYLLVEDSLRSVSDPCVFAAGDIATLASHPETPKAGVYAVREGPVLWKSLVAAVEATPPPAYSPQDGFLSILNTSDGKALLRYGPWVSSSRWAWRLKDAIDRRFMRKYQGLYAADRGNPKRH